MNNFSERRRICLILNLLFLGLRAACSALLSSRVLWQRETRAAAISAMTNALEEPNGYGITACLKGLTWQIIPPCSPCPGSTRFRLADAPEELSQAQRWWG